jgi:hypothetical protein
MPGGTFTFRTKDGVRKVPAKAVKVSREFYGKYRGKPIPADALAAEGKRMAEVDRKSRKPRAA